MTEPLNYKQLLTEFSQLNNEQKVAFLNQHCPELIVASGTKFHPQYKHLTDNWNYVCQKLGCQPAKILLLSKYPENSDNQFLYYICEMLTNSGFCVRKSEHYGRCLNCGVICPTETTHNIMAIKVLLPRWRDKSPCCQF